MKRALAILFTAILIGGPIYGQDSGEPQQVTLESFEKCNNWARHYCRRGNHEAMVNHLLLKMKERGMTITTAIIKSVAHRTLKDTAPPPSEGME